MATDYGAMVGVAGSFTKQLTLPGGTTVALIEALGLGWGTESVIVLYDVLQLEPEAAKHRMLTTCRWILRGALADAGKADSRRSRRPMPGASTTEPPTGVTPI